jgi:hypothetical protein
MSRVAIVIGVNKPKAPAPLQGAVSDAIGFATWIAKQGFETTSFVDDKNPVTFASIFAEVERVVNAGTYSQMVIYFAGHGLQNGGSEMWLLSGAPDNSGEAISVEASVMAARESGLASVVFISDACRSIPNNLQSSRLDGSSIFPNRQLNRRTRPEVDRLFATLPSLVAVEAAKADDKARREGVFTREFILSYRNPPAALIEQRSEAGRGRDQPQAEGSCAHAGRGCRLRGSASIRPASRVHRRIGGRLCRTGRTRPIADGRDARASFT